MKESKLSIPTFQRRHHTFALCLSFVLTAALHLLAVSHAAAGEIEPRAYGNAPVGVNFLIAGYGHSQGGLSTDSSSPLMDAHIRVDKVILAYARTLDIFGNPGKLDVMLPYSDLSGNAMVFGAYRERSVSGLDDPRLRISVNFVGAPVLAVKEFAGWQQELLVGASIQVSAPFGQYDSDKLVNIGNNRWFVKPEIGISRAWNRVTLELSTGAFIFSDNTNYFGGKKLEQDPVSSSQAHVMYSFDRGMWAALSATYDYGGRSTVNGVKNNDLQSNSRLGATFSMPIDRNNSAKLYASRGVSTRSGTDYDLVGIAWQYRWGNGL